MEKKLKDSEERTRAFLNAPIDSVTLIYTDGTILALNEATAQILGQETDELIGTCLYDYFSLGRPPPEKHSEKRLFAQRRSSASLTSEQAGYITTRFSPSSMPKET